MVLYREEVIIRVSSIVEERKGKQCHYDKMEVIVEDKLLYETRIVKPTMSKLTPHKFADYISARDIIRFAEIIRESSVDFEGKPALSVHNS